MSAGSAVSSSVRGKPLRAHREGPLEAGAAWRSGIAVVAAAATAQSTHDAVAAAEAALDAVDKATDIAFAAATSASEKVRTMREFIPKARKAAVASASAAASAATKASPAAASSRYVAKMTHLKNGVTSAVREMHFYSQKLDSLACGKYTAEDFVDGNKYRALLEKIDEIFGQLEASALLSSDLYLTGELASDWEEAKGYEDDEDDDDDSPRDSPPTEAELAYDMGLDFDELLDRRS